MQTRLLVTGCNARRVGDLKTLCLSQNVMQEEWEIYRYMRMSQHAIRGGWEIGTSGKVNSAVNMERKVRNMSSKKRRPAVAEAEKSTHVLHENTSKQQW